MTTSDNSASTKKGSSFPYKTLIWAALALIAMFLFKGELKGLLERADEVAIFGIELKVEKEQALKLETAIKSYKDKMADFNDQIAMQQERIASLENLKNQLEDDIANCPSAKANAELLNLEVGKIFKANTELKQKTEVLKNTTILKRRNLNIN